MMEWLAPVALVALLFILFGLSHRGRSHAGCGACTGEDDCGGKESRDCEKSDPSYSAITLSVRSPR